MHHLGKFNLGYLEDFIICVVFSEVIKHKQVKTNDIMSQHFGDLMMTCPLSKHEEMRARSKEVRPVDLHKWS